MNRPRRRQASATPKRNHCEPALAKRLEKLTSVLEVGKALMAERNLDTLLNMILREVTTVAEADRSSLYLVDKERGELRTKIAQGMGIEEIRVMIGTGIAGYVAQSGQSVNITDAYSDPRFSKETDRRTGYRTETILCVPMINKLGEVIGVCQVLNKHDGVFTKEDEDLLLALAGQAAVAIENAILYEDIQKLFEGFIRASVYAIESRDPTTSGHSERVAIYTVGLATCVDKVPSGPYGGVRFSPEEMKEIRYASLLHDFGKVGVRERVLVKANKLDESNYNLIRERFNYVRKALEADHAQRKLAMLLSIPKEDALRMFGEMDEELRARLAEIDQFFEFVAAANKPAVEKVRVSLEKLYDISRNTYVDIAGQCRPFLTSDEVNNLSIGQGSLNAQERLEIESHVTHTFHFLRQIPWTRELRRIPTIAYAHHEKLNGAGYPNQLFADEIPVQSRMMTVCDIYDALTATDRPYKRALSPERAIDILRSESSQGLVDRDMLTMFIEGRVYELTHRQAAVAP